jgi:DNA-binding LacI/PurR family transcriptional regulator
MSTISDVAKRAGVSAMTVSRVVNSTGYTSAETRGRVEAAIEELGYVPNALAR